jgi:hypothetical protein
MTTECHPTFTFYIEDVGFAVNPESSCMYRHDCPHNQRLIGDLRGIHASCTTVPRWLIRSRQLSASRHAHRTIVARAGRRRSFPDWWNSLDWTIAGDIAASGRWNSADGRTAERRRNFRERWDGHTGPLDGHDAAPVRPGSAVAGRYLERAAGRGAGSDHVAGWRSHRGSAVARTRSMVILARFWQHSLLN